MANKPMIDFDDDDFDEDDLTSTSTAKVNSAASMATHSAVTHPSTPTTTPSASGSPASDGNTQAPPLDSRYQRIGLPSHFHFYPFKELFLRTITPRDQFNLYRGHTTNDTRHTVDVISSCINGDGYALTVGDFYFILYELRLRSYAKSPYTVKWICTADSHLKEVSEGTKTQESLQQTTRVTQAVMTINEFTPEKWEEIVKVMGEIERDYGFKVTPMTVRDLVESADSLESVDEDEQATLAYIDRYASCLHSSHGDLKTRRELVINHPSPDLLSDLDMFITLTEHGVDEHFNVKCKECGTADRVKNSIDVPHFFPVSNSRADP